jgi:SAM-dependent methyltransferase
MSDLKGKDYFSTQAAVYAAFRPNYPQALFDFVLNHVPERRSAWDCGTGNGQVAIVLARHFTSVEATDISRKQLDAAPAAANVFYSVTPAEKTTFPNESFDLITVAQAIHWFDRGQFYNEVHRVIRKGGVIAVWGYSMLQINPLIDSIILNFYNNVVGRYWDEARRLVEDEYRSMEFPFEEIETPGFFISVQWNLSHLSGYFESWSATQQYIRAEGKNPIAVLMSEIAQYWEQGEYKEITFPVFLRLGRCSVF